MREPITPARLLLVADADHELRAHLAVNLRADGYEVAQAATPTHLRARLVAEPPALLMLGELDGEPVVSTLAAVRSPREIRPLDPDLPVLCLGPEGDELAELRTLRAGADDHLRKPVAYAIVLARLEALLRRSDANRHRGRIRIGRLQLDPTARDARVGATRLALSRMEYQLLLRLASEPTRVYSKAELLREVWGYRSSIRTRTVDSHACRLRNKLTAAGAAHHVVNVWGTGYRLLDPVTTPERNGSA